eukprot:TRINITY_DN743_c0_g1_i5.p1 TRINITY_DN743_c0_g1~~TRINITY_DN743_c0_g1_i5.p1  ORF type:complete len:498 (+),score=158.38 TRINITY_DN743_c0_g1_i5:132-1625(+)
MPLVAGAINNADWHQREAATLAFGAVLDGPRELSAYVAGALPVLLSHMQDPEPTVRETTAWTIGRVGQLHRKLLTPSLQQVVPVLFSSLDPAQSTPRVAANVCWAIHSLAEAYEEDVNEAGTSTPMSTYFQYLVQGLLKAAERADAHEDKLRSSAYAAVNTLVHCSAKDCAPYIASLVPNFLQRLHTAMGTTPGAVGHGNEHNEAVALVCGVLQECCSKLGKQIAAGGMADSLMTAFLQLLQSTPAVHEEAFIAIGAITTALEGDFLKYLAAVVPFVLRALRSPQEYEVCSIVTGYVGELCRTLPAQMAATCPEVMKCLLENLQSGTVDRSLKPDIISTLGDMAMSLAAEFIPYVGTVAQVLAQASTAASTPPDPDDEDAVEYTNKLRESICEGYTGMLQGLRACDRAGDMLPYVETILQFAAVIFADQHKTESLTRCVVGLLGDLAQLLGDKVKRYLFTPQVLKVLDEVRDSPVSMPTVEVANWARQLILDLERHP